MIESYLAIGWLVLSLVIVALLIHTSNLDRRHRRARRLLREQEEQLREVRAIARDEIAAVLADQDAHVEQLNRLRFGGEMVDREIAEDARWEAKLAARAAAAQLRGVAP